jgi:hypothetical protein
MEEQDQRQTVARTIDVHARSVFPAMPGRTVLAGAAPTAARTCRVRWRRTRFIRGGDRGLSFELMVGPPRGPNDQLARRPAWLKAAAAR